jgi:hypothetical protein
MAPIGSPALVTPGWTAVEPRLSVAPISLLMARSRE